MSDDLTLSFFTRTSQIEVYGIRTTVMGFFDEFAQGFIGGFLKSLGETLLDDSDENDDDDDEY